MTGTEGRPGSFMVNLLTLLEAFLIIIGIAIVAVGFGMGVEGWVYLGLAVFAILVIVHLARRNHRREMELHRPTSGFGVPELAPRVPTVPPIPAYDRRWETQAPRPPTVTFPREAGNRPPQGGVPQMGTASLACRSCGSWVRPGSRFCHRCGHPLNPQLP